MDWVGNIYHKFETVCQDMDKTSNQDKVKYVEDRVQTVVKKFCSDVLQDLIPPVKSKARDMASKNADADSCSKLVVKEKDYGSPPAEDKPPEADPSSNRHALDEIHFVKQLTDHVQEPHERHMVLEKPQLVSSNLNSSISSGAVAFDEKPVKSELLDLTETAEKDSFKASCGLIDHSQENVCRNQPVASHSTSVHGGDLAPQNVGTVSYDSADDQSSASNALSVGDLPEMASSVASGDDEIIEFHCSQNVGRVCINSTSECCSISNAPSTNTEDELSSSVLPSEKKISEMESPIPCSSIFTAKQSQSANQLSNITTGVVPCATSSGVASPYFEGCAVLLSSTSSPAGSSIIKEKGASLSLESIGSSPKSSYVGGDILDSQMESIDLSDKEKLEKSCVIVNNSLLYEVSRRIQKSRSYKKKIQDAFTSKKRLAKEYELLAIWYDDLDSSAPGKDAFLRRLSTGTTITVESDCTSGQMHDSGWELL